MSNLTKTISIEVTDMWCGGGGTTEGFFQAVKEFNQQSSGKQYAVKLTGVNHWEIAVATHSANHPKARHFCKSVDSLNPFQLHQNGRIFLLMASPECIHHSNARGGKPRSEQSRADVWDIKRWIEKLYVENLLIENVKEFVDWGPLGANGKPLKSKKGEFFREFISWLKILYKVEWKILNCADYGDATTRERFFLIARRGNKKIFFPEPSHASPKVLEKKQPELFSTNERKPWRPAREIIDWNLEGKSIFGRKKPLSINTIKRIEVGLFKYGLKNFLLNMKNKNRRDRSLDLPLFTQTTMNHQYLVEPFLIQFFGERKNQIPRTRSVENPVWTITAQNRTALVEPFICNINHTGKDVSNNRHEAYCYDLERPVPTVTTKNSFVIVEPFLVKYYTGSDAVSIDDPLPTVTANYEHLGLVEPFLIKWNNNQDAQSVNEPLKTLTTKDRYGLVEISVSGNGKTFIPKKDELGLFVPEWNAVLFIRLRMLQPHELASAMSFPKTYVFSGKKKHQIKQIGNAVPVKTAKALCKTFFQ